MWLGTRLHPTCSASSSWNTRVTLLRSHSAAWRNCCMNTVTQLWIITKVKNVSAATHKHTTDTLYSTLYSYVLSSTQRWKSGAALSFTNGKFTVCSFLSLGSCLVAAWVWRRGRRDELSSSDGFKRSTLVAGRRSCSRTRRGWTDLWQYRQETSYIIIYSFWWTLGFRESWLVIWLILIIFLIWCVILGLKHSLMCAAQWPKSLFVQELLEDGLLDQFHKSLVKLNMDSAEELQSYINKLQLAVEQGRQKLLQSDGVEGKTEVGVYSTKSENI